MSHPDMWHTEACQGLSKEVPLRRTWSRSIPQENHTLLKAFTRHAPSSVDDMLALETSNHELIAADPCSRPAYVPSTRLMVI